MNKAASYANFFANHYRPSRPRVVYFSKEDKRIVVYFSNDEFVAYCQARAVFVADCNFVACFKTVPGNSH